MQSIPAAPVRMERRPEVTARTGLPRAGIYAAMAAGDFPRPVKIGSRAVAWRTEEIDAWIASRQPATTEAA